MQTSWNVGQWIDVIAKFAPILTALIAATAGVIALRAMWVQRDIARKRASLDFFLKTEMDPALITAYSRYEAGVAELIKAPSLAQFEQTPAYQDIRSYLNIHELVAAGVTYGVLDDDVCYEFWVHELLEAHGKCKGLIDHIRHDGRSSVFQYCALEKLSENWTTRFDADTHTMNSRRSTRPSGPQPVSSAQSA